MRGETCDRILDDNDYIQENIIKKTRKVIGDMTEKQRFQKAEKHLYDALSYKQPRAHLHAVSSKLYSIVQAIRTNHFWDLTLNILSYVFMYSILFDPNSSLLYILIIQITILFLMFTDVILQIYYKSFEMMRITSKFQKRFYIKLVVLILLLADWIIFQALWVPGSRLIRPFRILRALLPILYDPITRKSFEALMSTVKDILVYFFCYGLLIVGFSIVGHQIIRVQGVELDQYTQKYSELSKMLFITYIMSTYDSYPDHQLPAIRQSYYIYIYFVIFVYLNVFLFVTIPTTLIFNSFRQTRSKTILIDEIKQQHSLILAFVSLGEHNLNISIQKLTKFLLFVYKHKVRYIHHITEICLKLDENNNDSIQVNEFMQLCKIMQTNSTMMPPIFHDWNYWISFRKILNNHLKIKKIIKTKLFKIITCIVIVLTFFNSIGQLYWEIEVLAILDNIFMSLYTIELIMKIIGLGPEKFLNDKWNKLDLCLILVTLILEFIPQYFIAHNSSVLFKMARIFRITTLIKLLSDNPSIHLQNSIYRKIRQLMGQTVIIIPIVLKFFPLFLISQYFLGIIGMQLFYDPKPHEGPYAHYDEFSNFRSFLGSQLIFVQVLVEAGWSMIAYDHASRSNFALIMIYFVACHIIIVLVLSSLLKGLVWQSYFTVDEEYNQKLQQNFAQQQRNKLMNEKIEQFEQIRIKVEENELFLPDTVIKRQLYENKLDEQIFLKLKTIYIKKYNNLGPNKRQKQRTVLFSHLIADRKILIDEIEIKDSRQSTNQLYNRIIKQNLRSLNEIQDIEQQDFQEVMQDLLSKLILNPKIKFAQGIVYPKVFMDFLEQRMKSPKIRIQKDFNVDKDLIGSQQSILFHTYQMNVLLEIQKSSRQQKILIIKNLIDEGIITQQKGAKLFAEKSLNRGWDMDASWIMRQMFLHETNAALIKKFQIEYFSDIYGKSFREINKVTIQPLLRYEATLIYCLKNILRYPQIASIDFFRMLSTIESSFSNRLLKKGSLFKFVYQIGQLSDNWFTVEYKDSQQNRIHFIKTGIWLYSKHMFEKQIYYAQDILYWDTNNLIDRASCHKYLKLFFQSFEGLALSLNDTHHFFASNPNFYIYDLYSFFIDTSLHQRYINRKLKVSKIMLVILSKEQQRPHQLQLSYELSDLTGVKKNIGKNEDFIFDESQDSTFDKLKKLEVLDYQKIIETQGLPYAYVINLIMQIQDILNIHSTTFLNQVEKVLNDQFQKI